MRTNNFRLTLWHERTVMNPEQSGDQDLFDEADSNGIAQGRKKRYGFGSTCRKAFRKRIAAKRLRGIPLRSLRRLGSTI